MLGLRMLLGTLSVGLPRGFDQDFVIRQHRIAPPIFSLLRRVVLYHQTRLELTKLTLKFV